MERIHGSMTLNQVAQHCGVNWSTVKRWVTDGVKGRKLQSIQLGGRTLVTPDAFASFISGGGHPQESELVKDKLAASLVELAGLGVRTVGFQSNKAKPPFPQTENHPSNPCPQ